MFPDENGNFTDNGIYECSLNKDKNESLEDKYIYFFISMENGDFLEFYYVVL